MKHPFKLGFLLKTFKGAGGGGAAGRSQFKEDQELQSWQNIGIEQATKVI